MAHRTLNPRTAFYGDMRETGRKRARKPAHPKYEGAIEAYRQEFGEEPLSYQGAAFDWYAALEERGWTYSTRYGWRRKLYGMK